jgi:predicted ATPase
MPGFALTAENAPVVAEIVRRLDGLPLAIELAAARLPLFTLPLLRDRLDNRLQFLTRGPRDLPPRQQTMRDVIDWSYDLLDPEDRVLFARLGVFVGGFTLDAVEAVCGQEGEQDPLQGVASLLESSLLRQQPPVWEQPRFDMLETLREYALERLTESDQGERLREQHAAFYARLADQGGRAFFSGEGERWLDRLDADYGNLRAALAWAQQAPGRQELGWRVVYDLAWLWYRRGYLNEGRQWYGRVMAQTEPLGESLLRAKILGRAGLIAMWQSDLGTAAGWMDRGLEIVRRVGDRPALAEALFGRGVLAVNRREDEIGDAYLQEALALFHEMGQEWFEAIILLHLGNIVFSRGDLPAAQVRMNASYALAQRVGDRWLTASAVNNWGEFARYRMDHEGAEGHYLESRALFESVGSAPDLARADHSLGWVALFRGDVSRARALFQSALALHQQLGIRRGVLECLIGLAAVCGAEGEPERAVACTSCARARFAALGAAMWPADGADMRRSLISVHAQLHDAAFAEAWRHGQRMTLEQALAEVHC